MMYRSIIWQTEWPWRANVILFFSWNYKLYFAELVFGTISRHWNMLSGRVLKSPPPIMNTRGLPVTPTYTI